MDETHDLSHGLIITAIIDNHFNGLNHEIKYEEIFKHQNFR
jgi:hypothetical protein